MMLMQKRFSFTVIFLFLTILAGCATLGIVSTPEQQVMTYEQVGTFLSGIKPNLQANCDAKIYDAATCASLKITYNNAVDAYQSAGDAKIAEIKAATPAEKSAAQGKYATAKAQLTKFIADLQKYFK